MAVKLIEHDASGYLYLVTEGVFGETFKAKTANMVDTSYKGMSYRGVSSFHPVTNPRTIAAHVAYLRKINLNECADIIERAALGQAL